MSDFWTKAKLNFAGPEGYIYRTNAERGIRYAPSVSVRHDINNVGDFLAVAGWNIHNLAAQYAFRVSRRFIQEQLARLSKLYPEFIKEREAEARKATLASQKQRYEKLIEYQRVIKDEKYGVVETNDKKTIQAVDAMGDLVPESLMLYYHSDTAETMAIRDNGAKGSIMVSETELKTKCICHIDLAPQISISSSKNLICTPVQGRDFTRKELISGGDIEISVSGNIASNLPGVYPSAAVRRFLKVMQYGGILNIHHFSLGHMEVTRVLVKEFNLPTPEYMNIQPYSFSCVAVEPDTEIKIQDTIKQFNDLAQGTVENPNTWWKKLLLYKKGEQVVNMGTNLGQMGLSELAGLLNKSI